MMESQVKAVSNVRFSQTASESPVSGRCSEIMLDSLRFHVISSYDSVLQH